MAAESSTMTAPPTEVFYTDKQKSILPAVVLGIGILPNALLSGIYIWAVFYAHPPLGAFAPVPFLAMLLLHLFLFFHSVRRTWRIFPSVVLSPEGINLQATPANVGLIKWAEVADLITYARYLRIVPRDAKAVLARCGWLKRVSNISLSRQMGFCVVDCEVKPEALRDRIIEHYEEYSKVAPQPHARFFARRSEPLAVKQARWQLMSTAHVRYGLIFVALLCLLTISYFAIPFQRQWREIFANADMAEGFIYGIGGGFIFTLFGFVAVLCLLKASLGFGKEYARLAELVALYEKQQLTDRTNESSADGQNYRDEQKRPQI